MSFPAESKKSLSIFKGLEEIIFYIIFFLEFFSLLVIHVLNDWMLYF